MKTIFLLVTLSSIVWSCNKGCVPYEGICACDQAPVESATPVKPSDEKPPKSGMPSYQDPHINALMLPSLVADDEKQDQERNEADSVGKKAAGVPVQ